MTLSTTAREAVSEALAAAAAEASIALTYTRGDDEAAVLARVASALDAYALEVHQLSATDLGTSRSLRFARPSRALAGVLAAGAIAPAAISASTSAAFAARQPVIKLPPNPGGESDDDPDAPIALPAAEAEPEPVAPPEAPAAPAPGAVPPLAAAAPAPAPAAPGVEPTEATTPDPPAPGPPETATSPVEAEVEPPAAPDPTPPPPAADPPAHVEPAAGASVPLPSGEPENAPAIGPDLEEVAERDMPPADLMSLVGSSGRPVNVHPPRPRPAAAAAVVAPAVVTTNPRIRPDGAGTAYVVRPGDSLWSIAAKHLPAGASSTRVALLTAALWERNAAQIGTNDPDVLHVGTHLTIPHPIQEIQ